MGTAWRGAQIGLLPNPSVYESVLAKNANIVRYQIADASGQLNTWDADEWKAFVIPYLDYLETLIPIFRGKARIVLDIHHPPGGFEPNGRAAMFTGSAPWGKPTLLEMWDYIADRFHGNEDVLVYDILNEPAGGTKKVANLMQQAVTLIRAKDLKTRISISSAYGDPKKFDSVPYILGDNRIWYQTHMYLPLQLTHQGLYGYPTAKTYPNGDLNKDKLKGYLQQVRDFQQSHNAKIFIGEFSISTFADTDTRFNYLTDLTDIFEDYGWHYTYHSWDNLSIPNVWDIQLYPAVGQVLYDKWSLNTKP